MVIKKANPAFYIDLNRCTGCQACAIACTFENGLLLNNSWRRIYSFNQTGIADIPRFHLSIACNHCTAAPCMKYCPALAYHRDETSSAVLIDAEKCIGCRYCSWVCPFDAPTFNKSAGTMEKCTFCNHRLQENMDPACTTACPTDALRRIDAEQIESPVIAGFPQTTIGPQIEITDLRAGSRQPEQTLQAAWPEQENLQPQSASKISLAKEWTLGVFTFIAALLVGWFSGSILSGKDVMLIPFVTLALVSLGISLQHLGRKARAWRAVLNWKRSWLSREILLYPLFLAAALASLAFTPYTIIFGWLAAMFGIFSVIAMDMVYAVVPRLNKKFVASGSVVFTSVVFAFYFAGLPQLTILVLLIKLVLFTKQTDSIHGLAILRIVCGLSAMLLLILKFSGFEPLLEVLLIFGELSDRLLFYDSIAVISPSLTIKYDEQKLWLK